MGLIEFRYIKEDRRFCVFMEKDNVLKHLAELGKGWQARELSIVGEHGEWMEVNTCEA